MAITFESVNKSNNDNFHVKPFVHSVIRGGGGDIPSFSAMFVVLLQNAHALCTVQTFPSFTKIRRNFFPTRRNGVEREILYTLEKNL